MAKKKKQKAYFPYKLIPLLIVLCIVPLVVYAKPIKYDTLSLNWYTSNVTTLVDIFNYYKSVLLQFCALIALMLILKKQLIDKISLPHTAYIPAYTYVLFLVISTVFSVNTYYSLNGYINHHESIWVLLSYVIIFIYVAEVEMDEHTLRIITYSWILSITVLFFIGLTQFLGFDLYRTAFGLKLITPPAIRSYISDVDFTLWSDNLIYQSLFHYNYVSFYAALAFPFFFTLLIGSKSRLIRFLSFIMIAILTFNFFGSQGRNGLIGILLGSGIALLLYGSKILFSKYTIAGGVSFLLMMLLFALTTDTVLERRILEAFTGLTAIVDYPLNEIHLKENTIRIDHDSFELTIEANSSAEGTVYRFIDDKGSDIPIQQEGNKVSLVPGDSSGSDYTKISFSLLTYDGSDVLQITLEKVQWNFLIDTDHFYYLNSAGRTEIIESAESYGFSGLEKWGSGRGFIWSRTIPLMFDRPLTGYGPDTYALAFPQNDYVGKLRAYGTNINTVVDKPHNIYMNYAVNTGLLSLLSILALVVFAYIRTIRYRLSISVMDPRSMYTVASIAAVTGYLSAGFFNDTSLQITPLFWVMLGINYALTKKEPS